MAAGKLMRLIDFIVCDDIRPEMSNKVSVMGVIGDALQLQTPGGQNTWPVGVRLSLYVRAALDPGDPVPDRVRLNASRGDSNIVLADGVFTAIDRPSLITVPLVMHQFQFTGPGAVTFKCLFTKNDETVGAFAQTLDVSMAKPMHAGSDPL